MNVGSMILPSGRQVRIINTKRGGGFSVGRSNVWTINVEAAEVRGGRSGGAHGGVFQGGMGGTVIAAARDIQIER
jgi:hypothetical protein